MSGRSPRPDAVALALGGLSCPALGSFRPLSITAERPLGWLLPASFTTHKAGRGVAVRRAPATWTSGRGQHARNGTGQAATWTPPTAYSSSATISGATMANMRAVG